MTSVFSNRGKFLWTFVLIVIPLVSVNYQGCGNGKFELASNFDTNVYNQSTSLELKAFDQINGQTVGIPTTESLVVGQTYHFVSSSKLARPVGPGTTWTLTSTPQDSCSLSNPTSQGSERSVICTAPGVFDLTVTVHYSDQVLPDQDTTENQYIVESTQNLKSRGNILYGQKIGSASACADCHGSLISSTKKNKTSDQIAEAISNISSMSNNSFKLLNATELRSLALALKANSGSDDTIPPVISFSNPISGQTLSGAVAISVSASDNIGVVGVTYSIDGVVNGPEIMSAPYGKNLDTLTLSNASHTLSAKARDAAGNETTVAVVVDVDNGTGSGADTVPPAVSIVSPTMNKEIFENSLVVAVTASDNVGVAGVKMTLDGTAFGAEDLSAPFQFTVSAVQIAAYPVNSVHSITIEARDAAGNKKSAAVNFKKVENPFTIPQTVLATRIPTTISNMLTGRDLWNANCVGCHTIEKRNAAYSLMRLKVGARTCNPSLAVGPTACQPAMTGISLTSEEVYKIFLYLNNALPSAGTLKEQSQVLIGSRTLVASAFTNLFVSDAGTAAADPTIRAKIAALILQQPGSFGGVCTRNDATPEDQTCMSQSGTTTSGELLSSPNVLRSGFIARTCEEVLSIDQSVSNLLQKAGLTTASPIDAANSIPKVFDLFLPGTVLPAAVTSSLLAISVDADLITPVDKWRYVIYAICRSSRFDLL